jgi:hypothetical protein
MMYAPSFWEGRRLQGSTFTVCIKCMSSHSSSTPAPRHRLWTLLWYSSRLLRSIQQEQQTVWCSAEPRSPGTLCSGMEAPVSATVAEIRPRPTRLGYARKKEEPRGGNRGVAAGPKRAERPKGRNVQLGSGLMSAEALKCGRGLGREQVGCGKGGKSALGMDV